MSLDISQKPTMSTFTDTGHHNCRDYHLPLHSSSTTTHLSPHPQTTSQILALRAAQKSPLNKPITRPSFPFQRLPYELRRQVYSYLLPWTETKAAPGSLFSTPCSSANAAVTAHQIHLASLPAAKYGRDTTLWHRGQTSLLCVNKQLWKECSEILYGDNVFVLFVTYDLISFRFRWILPSRLAPSMAYDFLQLLGGTKYLSLVKRLVVSVDHVDSYTGMIKYNVGGSGLTHGLRLQVRKLVRALLEGCDDPNEDAGLKKLTVRLMNGNEVLDSEKKGIVRSRESSIRSTEDVQTVLEPLSELAGLADVSLYGAITDEYKADLKRRMMQTR